MVKGGNESNQTRFLHYANNHEQAPQFFERVDKIFEVASERVRPGTRTSECDEYSLLLHIIPLLKELNEGHRTALQLFMSRQVRSSNASASTKHTSFNLLKRASMFILAVTADEVEFSRHCDTDLVICVTELYNFMIEATQGPCRENQDTLLWSNVVTATQRVLASQLAIERKVWGLIVVGTEKSGKEKLNADTEAVVNNSGLANLVLTFKRLKEMSIKILLSLMEGRNDTEAHERIIRELNTDSLELRLSQLFSRWTMLCEVGMKDSESKHPMLTNPLFRRYMLDEAWLDEGFDIMALFQFLKEVDQEQEHDGNVSTAGMIMSEEVFDDKHFYELESLQNKLKIEMEVLASRSSELDLFTSGTRKKRWESQFCQGGGVNVVLATNWQENQRIWNTARFQRAMAGLKIDLVKKLDVGKMRQEHQHQGSVMDIIKAKEGLVGGAGGAGGGSGKEEESRLVHE